MNNFHIFLLSVSEHSVVSKYNKYRRRKGAQSRWNYKPKYRPTTNSINTVDFLFMHVHVSKVNVLQGCYKCHFHTACQKRSHVVNGLLFSPEKQGLEIPNMLWRLESNSLEFQAPYGDKVLASPLLLEICFLCQEFQHLFYGQNKDWATEWSKEKANSVLWNNVMLVWMDKPPLIGCSESKLWTVK